MAFKDFARGLIFDGNKEKRDSLENPSTDLVTALMGSDGLSFGGGGMAAGVNVSGETAMRFVSVYAAVRVIAETLGSLPFELTQQVGRSKVPSNDPRAFLLSDQPNPEMDAMVLWEMVLGHLNLWGNAYLYKVMDPGTGITTQLWPLMPNLTRPYKLPDGTLTYVTRLNNGQDQVLVADEVIHVRAFGTGTGNVGISPIGAARQAIGIGVAADEYAGRFFRNDARAGGLILADGAMSDDAFRQFVKRWNAAHQGLNNSHLMGVLDQGMKWQDVGVPAGDAQFIETRKWQKLEIATAFRIPPHKIGSIEQGQISYASVEQFNMDFVSETVRPWATRIEQAVKRGIFGSEPDRAINLSPRFNLGDLLRGDQLTRYKSYQLALNSGWMLRSEAREAEGYPWIDGMDEPLPIIAPEITATPIAE